MNTRTPSPSTVTAPVVRADYRARTGDASALRKELRAYGYAQMAEQVTTGAESDMWEALAARAIA